MPIDKSTSQATGSDLGDLGTWSTEYQARRSTDRVPTASDQGAGAPVEGIEPGSDTTVGPSGNYVETANAEEGSGTDYDPSKINGLADEAYSKPPLTSADAPTGGVDLGSEVKDTIGLGLKIAGVILVVAIVLWAVRKM